VAGAADAHQHAETGAQLPRALFDRIVAARNFQSGMHLARQLEFGLFDLRLHSDFDPERADAAALQPWRVRCVPSRRVFPPASTAAPTASRTSFQAVTRRLLQLPVGRGAVVGLLCRLRELVT